MFNDKGGGPWSDEKTARTKEDGESNNRNLKVWRCHRGIPTDNLRGAHTAFFTEVVEAAIFSCMVLY